MARKKKEKKMSAKKEKYVKFANKEKPGTLDLSFPDLDDEQTDMKRQDETKIDKHLRFNRNFPTKEIVTRKMKSKR